METVFWAWATAPNVESSSVRNIIIFFILLFLLYV